MSNQTTRRDVLKGATVASAAMLTPSLLPKSSFAEDKNDRFVLAGIGMGGMGSGDCRGHCGYGDFAMFADVDMGHAERANAKIAGGKAKVTQNYKEVLDNKDIEVVSIATPDHWHVMICLEALAAGKHVFCQKPLTLTLEENLMIRDACKKYDKQTFFIGTQQRSDRGKFMRAVNMVQKGLLGKMKKVTCSIGGGSTGGPFKKEAPPANLDWKFWLGPAPTVEYIKQRCHGNFRWWYEYSGGKFTDWGAHHIDIAMWAMNLQNLEDGPTVINGKDAKHPVPFEKGYPTKDDCYNTANDYDVISQLPNGVELHVTSRGQNGVTFEGEKGTIFVSRGTIKGKPIEENWDKDKYTEEDTTRLYKGKKVAGHKTNFFQCIREGGLPVSDAFSHITAMSICHLSAIAARLGRELKWDAKNQKFIGDDEAQSFFARTPTKGYEYPKV